MKKGKIVFVLLFLAVVFKLSAQENPPKNYLVIGVFAVHNNAIRLTDKANKMNFSAQYAIHPSRKLYFVYLLESNDKKHAFAQVLKIRMETEFKDAWVFTGVLGEKQAAPTVTPKPAEPVVEVKPEPVVTEPAPAPIIETPKSEPVAAPIVETPVAPVVVEKPPVVEAPKPSGKPFYFKLIDSDKGTEVMGEVHIMESAKAAQYQAYSGNDLVYLNAPRNAASTYVVTVSAPGYKPVSHLLNYKQPAGEDVTIGTQQEAILTLPLIRSRKGDYIEFNKVFFLRNSAIFQPQSKDELDGLAQLMKEEPNYKIKIHGHTNGKEDRDVVSMGTSTNYFATDPGNKKEKATAKVLSELRAETLKNYLMSQGVDGDRISTKGEGGNMMIYGQNSTLSTYNDRVEIEVAKGK
jgi:outer membrane protein OmpA-like peptidoglycan-associated protein